MTILTAGKNDVKTTRPISVPLARAVFVRFKFKTVFSQVKQVSLNLVPSTLPEIIRSDVGHIAHYTKQKSEKSRKVHDGACGFSLELE